MNIRTISSIIAICLLVGVGVGYYYYQSSQWNIMAGRQILTLVTEATYPPFNTLDASGKAVGFDIDIANTLCDRVHIKCIVTVDKWDNIPPGLLTKKYDVIVNSMSITEERQKYYSFSDPYYSNKLAFVVQQTKQKHYTSQSDLKNKVVAAQSSTVSFAYLKGISDLVGVKEYPTQEEVWLALTTGQVDAVLTDRLIAYEWLKNHQGNSYSFLGDAIDIRDKIGFAFRKDDIYLIQAFNKALAEILRDGTYQQITAKYFPFSIY